MGWQGRAEVGVLGRGGGCVCGGGVFDELYMPVTFIGACLIYELEKEAKQLKQHWALSAVECNSQFP